MGCVSGIGSNTLARSAGYWVGYKWGGQLDEVCCNEAAVGGCSKAAERGELRQELTHELSCRSDDFSGGKFSWGKVAEMLEIVDCLEWESSLHSSGILPASGFKHS